MGSDCFESVGDWLGNDWSGAAGGVAAVGVGVGSVDAVADGTAAKLKKMLAAAAVHAAVSTDTVCLLWPLPGSKLGFLRFGLFIYNSGKGFLGPRETWVTARTRIGQAGTSTMSARPKS